MAFEYIKELRAQTNMSWADLEEATGYPESTIRDHVSGKTKKPNQQLLLAVVCAMGGDTSRIHGIPAEIRADLAEVRRIKDENEDMHDLIDSMRRIRGEMLVEQKEAYEERINAIKESHSREIALLEKHCAMQRKVCYLLAAAMFVLLIAIIGVLVFDISCHDQGWFTTAAAAAHMVGGIL